VLKLFYSTPITLSVASVLHGICCFDGSLCVCQKQNDKELSSETLSHLAKSLTLWEFMMLKIGHSRAHAEQSKVAEMLTEFSELHAKVKAVSHSMLTPARAASYVDRSDTSKHVMVTCSLY